MKYKIKVNKKPKYSKCIVAFIIALVIIFSAAVLIVFAMTGSEPQNLVIAFFAFVTSELWNLAKIKREEVKHDGPTHKQDSKPSKSNLWGSGGRAE